MPETSDAVSWTRAMCVASRSATIRSPPPRVAFTVARNVGRAPRTSISSPPNSSPSRRTVTATFCVASSMMCILAFASLVSSSSFSSTLFTVSADVWTCRSEALLTATGPAAACGPEGGSPGAARRGTGITPRSDSTLRRCWSIESWRRSSLRSSALAPAATRLAV